MATVYAFPGPRAPVAIFAEIATVRTRLVGFYAVLEELNDDEDREWQDLEARLDALKAEADAALVALTGQPFGAWEGALS